jgi:hypothetical protein
MNTHFRSATRSLVALTTAVVIGGVGCSRPRTELMANTVNPKALEGLKTFSVSAPAPDEARVVTVSTNGTDRAGGAAMNMDPTLDSSLVGRAMRQDIVVAFSDRGYVSTISAPDFNVYYYAGTGRVVDTHWSESRYRVDGAKVKSQTLEYPAGTIVVDVVDARSDSLLWRGTGIAEIPDNPDDYAKAVRKTIDRVVGQFPNAKH